MLLNHGLAGMASTTEPFPTLCSSVFNKLGQGRPGKASLVPGSLDVDSARVVPDFVRYDTTFRWALEREGMTELGPRHGGIRGIGQLTGYFRDHAPGGGVGKEVTAGVFDGRFGQRLGAADLDHTTPGNDRIGTRRGGPDEIKRQIRGGEHFPRRESGQDCAGKRTVGHEGQRPAGNQSCWALEPPGDRQAEGGAADAELHEIESGEVPQWPVGEFLSAESLHLFEPGQPENAWVLQVREVPLDRFIDRHTRLASLHDDDASQQM